MYLVFIFFNFFFFQAEDGIRDSPVTGVQTCALPISFSFIDQAGYYQFITMHGMIMVVYLLTALFLGGFEIGRASCRERV